MTVEIKGCPRFCYAIGFEKNNFYVFFIKMSCFDQTYSFKKENY